MSKASVVVKKYGGSSLSTIEKIRLVSDKIKGELKKSGAKVVMVVSAMGDSTEELLEMAHQAAAGGKEDLRELDALVATGEMVSASTMALALNAAGIKSISLSGVQAGIITEDKHISARIAKVNTKRIESELLTHQVVVVAGFQGVDKEGDLTTLGRGGSDTTAVAMAIALQAKICEIYTDVDGIYTADPRICKSARKIDEINFEEMLELSAFGAKMNPRSIELAALYGVPLYVASTHNSTKGTKIDSKIRREGMDLDKKVVTGIAVTKNVAKVVLLGVEDRPGVVATILKPLSDRGISIDIIVQNTSATTKKTDFTFTIGEEEAGRVEEIMKEITLDFSSFLVGKGFAKVSVVGTGMLNSPGYASTMFSALAEVDVNIDIISTSEIRITCVINGSDVKKAVNALHKAFNLELK